MQGVNNQGTINIVIDSSIKQNLNLHLGQAYEAKVFSVSDDGKVTIKIGGQEIVAESKVALQPGQKILVEVKENANGLILLQVKNNLNSTVKSAINLLRESIINNLAAQNLPLKEENIVISQGLIKYNLRVSSENIQKVLNGLVSSGYQNELSDYNIVESGVLLFAKGLPLTRDTMALTGFLKQEKGQVINNITELDNEIDQVIETIIKNALQNPEEINDLHASPSSILKDFLEKLPNPLRPKLEKLLTESLANQNHESVITQGKDNEKSLHENLLQKVSRELNENIAIENMMLDDEPVTKDLRLLNSLKPQDINNEDNTSLIPDKHTSKAVETSKVLDNIKLLSGLKELLGKTILKIDPKELDIKELDIKELDIKEFDIKGNNTANNIAEKIKNVASYMVEGEKSLEGDFREKFNVSFKELVAKLILENLLVKPEEAHNKLGKPQQFDSIIKDQLGKLEGSFSEISKHFEAVKLYNAGINDTAKDNFNNYYLLSLPTQVAGENLDNKIYFWSQGSKKRKIDPESMRIVLCLNTKSLGLLKIDLAVAKKDIYAGIEVTDLRVKNFIEEHGLALEEQLASHKYRLKNINCSLKKPEDISTAPSEIPENISALDLRI